jgi:hypothetical protein
LELFLDYVDLNKMNLSLNEAIEISKELKRSHIQAVVGEGLDKIYMYVYSVDPLITCNCNRKSFDEQASRVVTQRLEQYKNVEVKLSGPATGR